MPERFCFSIEKQSDVLRVMPVAGRDALRDDCAHACRGRLPIRDIAVIADFSQVTLPIRRDIMACSLRAYFTSPQRWPLQIAGRFRYSSLLSRMRDASHSAAISSCRISMLIADAAEPLTPRRCYYLATIPSELQTFTGICRRWCANACAEMIYHLPTFLLTRFYLPAFSGSKPREPSCRRCPYTYCAQHGKAILLTLEMRFARPRVDFDASASLLYISKCSLVGDRLRRIADAGRFLAFSVDGSTASRKPDFHA